MNDDICLELVITLEIMLSSFIIWGIINEKRLIEFERRMWVKIKRFARIIYFIITSDV